MKNFPLFTAGSALALGALLILAPQSHAAGKYSGLSPVDVEFLHREASAGKAIIRIAEEAATRGEKATVRAFARSLVRDHTRTNEALAKLARSKGVEPESGDSPEHEARFDQLGKETGAAFDAAFIALMIELHKASAENFEKTATDSPDADLKRWAREMLPGLTAHLEKAKEFTPSKTASADLPHLIVL